MTKLIDKGILIIVTMVIMMSCNVDKSYDLSSIDSDCLGFGTDETSFVIPLFSVTFAIPINEAETKSSGYSFDVEGVTNAIEIGVDIIDILDSNLDGDKNTISLIVNTTTSQGLNVSATPMIGFTDYNGEYREFEVGSVYDEYDEDGVITDIKSMHALFESISIKASVSIEEADFSVKEIAPEDRYIIMEFSAYKRGSLIL